MKVRKVACLLAVVSLVLLISTSLYAKEEKPTPGVNAPRGGVEFTSKPAPVTGQVAAISYCPTFWRRIDLKDSDKWDFIKPGTTKMNDKTITNAYVCRFKKFEFENWVNSTGAGCQEGTTFAAYTDKEYYCTSEGNINISEIRCAPGYAFDGRWENHLECDENAAVKRKHTISSNGYTCNKKDTCLSPQATPYILQRECGAAMPSIPYLENDVSCVTLGE